MNTITLNIAQVSNRGNKFGIIAGSVVLAKFKTVELAKESLNKQRKTYEYWAESASVRVDNSKKFKVIL